MKIDHCFSHFKERCRMTIIEIFQTSQENKSESQDTWKPEEIIVGCLYSDTSTIRSKTDPTFKAACVSSARRKRWPQGAGHISQKGHRNGHMQDIWTKHKCVQRHKACRNTGLCVFLWSSIKFHTTHICNSGISRRSQTHRMVWV